jgi:hypothetical protein
MAQGKAPCKEKSIDLINHPAAMTAHLLRKLPLPHPHPKY